MKLIPTVIFICFISFRINCQEYSPDSSSISNSALKQQSRIESTPEGMFIFRMNTLGPNEFYHARGNSFSLNLNLPVNQFYLNEKNLLYHNLFLSSRYQESLLDYNKNKMFNSFYNFYEQSRPTSMQKLLGMMQLSGAAFLAGYHIYKYSIKKKD